MRLFYLHCSMITQTVSAQSPSSPKEHPPNMVNLSELMRLFPLLWSAYARLLSIKNEAARNFYETGSLHYFAFIGRQRYLRLDDTWFRIDLLFFHRRLKCLLIIDLKIGKFRHVDADQMNLYLNYAREHGANPGENPSIGFILCANKGAAEAHYAFENLPNKVLAAEYWTVLPDEKLLASELEKSRRELEYKKSNILSHSTFDKAYNRK